MSEVEFEGWYRAQHPKLVSALAIIAGDAGVAAEVVDEAFTRAYERWGRLRVMESPSGWAFRTALNVLRRRQRRATLEARLHVRWFAGGASDHTVPSPPADWSVEVWDAMRRLPVRERTALALRYVADLTTSEIADAMGVAPGTVGSTLHAARRNLAHLLDPSTGMTHPQTIDEETSHA